MKHTIILTDKEAAWLVGLVSDVPFDFCKRDDLDTLRELVSKLPSSGATKRKLRMEIAEALRAKLDTKAAINGETMTKNATLVTIEEVGIGRRLNEAVLDMAVSKLKIPSATALSAHVAFAVVFMVKDGDRRAVMWAAEFADGDGVGECRKIAKRYAENLKKGESVEIGLFEIPIAALTQFARVEVIEAKA